MADPNERIIVVYERVSTDRQDLTRQAVQRQRAEGKYPGREIDVVQDDGVSAFKFSIFEREGGRRLVELIGAGQVEAVYADAQDRLSRGKLAEWVNFKALCDEHGTRIIVDGREIRADHEADEILSVFEAIRARRESIEKSHRVSGGLAVRAARGLPNGGPVPYGYGYRDKSPSGKPGGPMVPVSAEAEVVRRIFVEWNAGTSQKEIARRLNADGIKRRTTSAMNVSQVTRRQTGSAAARATTSRRSLGRRRRSGKSRSRTASSRRRQ